MDERAEGDSLTTNRDQRRRSTFWTMLPLIVGGALLPLMLYWAASHRLQRPFGLVWPIVAGAYRDRYDPYGVAHLLLFFPFAILAAFGYFQGRLMPGRMRLPVFIILHLLLLGFLITPGVIHALKSAYLYNDAPPFLSVAYFGYPLAGLSVFLLLLPAQLFLFVPRRHIFIRTVRTGEAA